MALVAHGELLNDSPRARTVHGLRQCILEGLFLTGDRLPAEQKLARRFHVSRGTVRAALERLEEEGLIKGRKNCGYTIVHQSAARSGLMARTVSLLTSFKEEPKPGLYSAKMKAVESGIADEVRKTGLNLLTLHTGEFGQHGVDGLLTDRPMGLVVSCLLEDPGLDQSALLRLSEAKVPLVVHSDAPMFSRYDRVTSDHYSGTAELVRHLISRGRRRILRLWTTDTYWIDAHNQAYEQAMAAAGIEPIPAVYVSDMPFRAEESREAFAARTRHLAGYLVEHFQDARKIDAIMVATDCEVFPTAAACRLFGADPAGDVVVAGYDNSWEDAFERQWEPAVPVATVEKNNHGIGEELVRLLVDRVEGRLEETAQRRVVPQKLVVTQAEARATT
ncbi:MAG TPA: hypothetical protein DCX07_03870 [Phycisphaerales bacterium]|nr:hypothetical protein [Phycisphaerales bacterium]